LDDEVVRQGGPAVLRSRLLLSRASPPLGGESARHGGGLVGFLRASCFYVCYGECVDRVQAGGGESLPI
jgi:hypothetical protein